MTLVLKCDGNVIFTENIFSFSRIDTRKLLGADISRYVSTQELFPMLGIYMSLDIFNGEIVLEHLDKVEFIKNKVYQENETLRSTLSFVTRK